MDEESEFEAGSAKESVCPRRRHFRVWCPVRIQPTFRNPQRAMEPIPPNLPKTDPTPSLAVGAFPSLASASEPAKTLLVVDDEPTVRALEVEILRLQGYTVLEAESAAVALRLADKAATIDLLITDLMMPEVDGIQLTRLFREMRPETPVLMVSGSLPLSRFRDEPDLYRFDCLAKPFHLDELLGKVRTLLDTAVQLPIRQPASSRRMTQAI